MQREELPRMHSMSFGMKNGKGYVTYCGKMYPVENQDDCRFGSVFGLGMHIEVCVLGHNNDLPGEKITDSKGRKVTLCRIERPIVAA
ncbi:MAG TPA: hypothetical protein VHF05_02720 [Candidatus Paceibacterota bacterium]|nr:hypothetical protein [Candidatus Paceibacterota bacterium]